MDIAIKEEIQDENYDLEKIIKEEVLEQLDVPDVIDPASLLSIDTSVVCDKCYRSFMNTEDLEIHDIIHTNDRYCSLCKKWFTKRSDLVTHVKTHLTCKSHKCEQCLRSFVTRKELTMHIRVHTNERPFKCKECDKAFKQRGALMDHRLVHTKEKLHTCPVNKCGITFTTKSSVRRHMKRIHKLCTFEISAKVNTESEMITCEICAIQFARKCDLYTHTKEKHGNDEFKCNDCNKFFNSYFVLTVHIEDKHKPRMCNVCDQSFSGSPELSEHLKEHYKCTQCEKGFASTSSLNTHVRVYHDKNYQRCNICYKKFKDLETVTAHLLKHRNRKDLPCKFCPKMFRSKEGLNRHKKLNHFTNAFVCNVCGRTNDSQESLDKHMKKHEKYKAILKFSCSVCTAGFRFKVNLLNHIKNLHPELDFSCNYCGKNCTSKLDLSRHTTNNCSMKTDNKCNFCNSTYRNLHSLKKHYRMEHSKAVKQMEQLEVQIIQGTVADVNIDSGPAETIAIKKEIVDAEFNNFTNVLD